MRKLFKKSLACVLAVALCLTAMVGALTVAADTTANITITSEPVAPGAATADVQIKIGADDMNVAYVDIATEAGSISDATTATVGAEIDFNGNRIEVDFPNDGNQLTSGDEVVIDVVLALVADIAAGEYDITATIATAADINEGIIAGSGAGKIVVSDPHTHTPDEAVVENNVPADCDKDGSYDTVIYCMDCGEEISRETIRVPAGHAGDVPVEENRVDSTCTVEGSYDTVVYCMNCGEEISRTTVPLPIADHNYAEGKCTVCGAADPSVPVGPVVDENITITPAINITATINIRYTITNVPECDDFYVEFVHDKCNTSYNFNSEKTTTTVYKSDLTVSGARYFYLFNGMGMYELNIPIAVTVYCLDANDNVIYCSNVATTTIADKAKDGFNATNTPEKTKILYSDIIVLASEAQRFFTSTRPTCDLATKVSVPDEGFTGTPTASVDKDALNKTNTEDIKANNISVTKDVNLGGNPALRYIVTGASNYSDFTMKVSYTSPKLGLVSETYTIDQLTAAGARHALLFSGIALYDGNQTVTVELKDGETVLYTGGYSIETKISTVAETASNYDLYIAIAKLGISARNQFGI